MKGVPRHNEGDVTLMRGTVMQTPRVRGMAMQTPRVCAAW